MEYLKFRANQTTPQKRNLTPGKIYNLRIVNKFKNSFGEIYFVATNGLNNYFLSQYEDNEFGMRKMQSFVDAELFDLESYKNNLTEYLIHKNINGRIANFYKIN